MWRAYSVLVAALFVTTAQAATVYHWVNQDGEVIYQDSPPPPGARDVRTEQFQGGTVTRGPERARVTLYQIPHCQPCASARQYLSRNHVPYRTVDATSAAAQARMQQKTGYTSVPTLTVGHASINGFNEPWLASELTRAGYLSHSAPAPH